MEIKTLVLKKDIKEGLLKLRITQDDTIVVHSSLSKLGWVCGGPQAVVEALRETVSQGTILMPSQSYDNSDPSFWQAPPVPEDWWQKIREETPAYNPKISPVRGMGKIVETLMYYEDVQRSNHPQASFCGVGKKANYFLKDHALHFSLYKNTPVEKMYQEDVKIVLLGVNYDNCTAMHYAEYETKVRKELLQGAAMIENGKRVWKPIKDLQLDSDIFVEIGNIMEEKGLIEITKIGEATVKVFSAKTAIDEAIAYFEDKKSKMIYTEHEISYDY